MKYVIILNGPPGTGKDTIAEGLVRAHGNKIEHMQFKSQLFKIALLVSGIPEDEWNARYSCQQTKNLPWELLGGLSQRQFMIRISEEWCKPTFGKNYFGLIAAREVAKSDKPIIVFSDGGFVEEIKELLASNNIKLLVVHLHRDGHTFDGDSRDYIFGHQHTIQYINDGSIDQAIDDVFGSICEFINLTK